MKKRIALLFPTLSHGGVFRVMTNLAQGLYEKGYAIDILTARGNDAYIAEHSAPDFRFFPFHKKHMLAGLPQLVHYLHSQKPAFLISAQTHTNLSAILAGHLTGHQTKCIVTEHSHPPSMLTYAPTQKEKLVLQMTKSLYKYADAIVGVSRGVTEGLTELLGWSNKKIQAIHTPLVSETMLKKINEPLSHPWFEQGQPPVILSVGRLAKEKDYPTLLKAFSIVRNSTDARFMILGEGETREELEQRIRTLGLEDDVLLPGFVDNPLPYMKHAEVFVLSSLWEGFPSVLIEALASGSPIVSTRCPSGPDEILEDGKWGELVEVGNTDALASAILKKLESGTVPGQADYARRFSLSNAVQKYIDLMNSMEEA